MKLISQSRTAASWPPIASSLSRPPSRQFRSLYPILLPSRLSCRLPALHGCMCLCVLLFIGLSRRSLLFLCVFCCC